MENLNTRVASRKSSNPAYDQKRAVQTRTISAVEYATVQTGQNSELLEFARSGNVLRYEDRNYRYDEESGVLVAAGTPDFAISTSILTGRKTQAKMMLFGASQHSRCSVEESITQVEILNEVCTVTIARNLPTLPSLGYLDGLYAFCTVKNAQVWGPITNIAPNQMTIPAPGMPDTGVINAPNSSFLHFTGMHTGASWYGRILSAYGTAIRDVGNLSKHGDNVDDVKVRMAVLRKAIAKMRPDLLAFEPGWGNSLAQNKDFEQYFPDAVELLEEVSKLVPFVVVTTLPPQASTAPTPTADQIRRYNQINDYVLNELPKQIPNVIVVDVVPSTLDYTSAVSASIANVHSDDLHWMPYGAQLIYLAYKSVFDKIFTFIDPGRRGLGDVWAKGNKQLYGGMDALSVTAPGGGATGVIDPTMTYSKQGGATTAAFSMPLLPNGLYSQLVKYSGMASAVINQISITKDKDGTLLYTYLKPGNWYRPAIKASISNLAGNGSNAVEFLAQITMTGRPNMTGSRLCWAGRYQEGWVESSGGVPTNNFAQQQDELDRWYVGNDFQVPEGVVTAFEMTQLTRGGSSTPGVWVEIKDICIRDVTELYSH